MPRKLLKRFMPKHDTIRNHKNLKFFGTLLHHPNLWHVNRRSIAGAFAVGLFIAFVPLPFQMVLAAAAAIALHVNLPISVTLVWISNPLTIPVLFYIAYKVGAWMLGVTIQNVSFELSIEWLSSQAAVVWQPFLFGCFVLGVFSAAIGYLFIHSFWRLRVIKNWQSRKDRRLL